MAKIEFSRLNKEDFPEEQRSLIDSLAGILNPFMEKVGLAFEKNITTENLNEEYKDVVITVDALGTPIQSTGFKNGLVSRVKGLTVVRADNLTNPAIYPTSQPFISFDQTGTNVINIKNVSGLQANQKYKLLVLSRG